jgi:preprotein translocase subunit SecB
MVNVFLEGQLVNEVSYLFNMDESGEIEIECSYTFEVSYIEEKKKMVVNFEQKAINNAAPEKLSITIKLTGYFSYDNIETDDDRKVAHVLAYQQLFPYAQSIASFLTTTSGAPPLLIPMLKQKPEELVINDVK